MSVELPYTLVAELTYRCPLRCPYCSNPLDFAARSAELPTDVWLSVLEQAADLGVLQVHFSGGEPLSRKDLTSLVQHAAKLGLYVQLVTSGIMADEARLAELAEAGLSCVQVSIQAAHAALADRIAGYPGFEQKRRVMGWVKRLGLPLTMNVVLHRENLDDLDPLIALAEAHAVDRLELANTQYLGWALSNRDALMPSRDQLERAHRKARAAAERLRGRMEVLFVMPDYHARYPRACMDGWARRFLHITPNGSALPCHAAMSLPHLVFPSVTDHPLAWIWHESPSFCAYRGESWMAQPCRSCDRRMVDFGGCRCQAFALTGDATATDPACSLAPTHESVVHARTAAERPIPAEYLYRSRDAASRAGAVSPRALAIPKGRR